MIMVSQERRGTLGSLLEGCGNDDLCFDLLKANLPFKSL